MFTVINIQIKPYSIDFLSKRSAVVDDKIIKPDEIILA